MNATSISFGLLIVLFTILLLHWMRKLKPQITGFRSQRMCPSCGLITTRLKARCLECGVASVSEERLNNILRTLQSFETRSSLSSTTSTTRGVGAA